MKNTKKLRKVVEPQQRGQMVFIKPNVVVSKCRAFARCRWNMETFFQLYPEELIDITDSGKGRDR